jgi:hypothetical protein
MPNSFLGLFLFSLALSLIATFTTLGLLRLVRSGLAARDEGSAAGR